MKRDFLKDLGLEDEAINKIMAEHGKTIESKKSEFETLQTQNESLKTQMEETQGKLKDFESMDIESIKKSAEDMKSKYEADTKALNDQIAKQNYNFSAKEYLSGFEYANDLTKEAVYNKFIEKEFKLEDGKFLGADDFLNQLKESQPTAFKTSDTNTKPDFGTPTGGEGNGEGGDDDAFRKAVLG